MDGVVSTTPEASSYVGNTTRVVPHGINLDQFEPPADKQFAWLSMGLPGRYGIGVFGRVRPDKGTDIFIEAMLRVLPEFPDFCAVILGLAQEQHRAFQMQLKQRVDKCGMADRIHFMGEIPHDQVADWYRSVLITVACPRIEAFGLTPLEGMACGSAVIASDTGAFRTMVDEGITGYVVPIDDIELLTDRLRSLMQNPIKTLEMGRDARKRVERLFSVENEAEGIQVVYDLVWNNNNRAK